MSDAAIHCQGIGKQYRIGRRESYKAFRDVLADTISSPVRRLRSALQSKNGNGAIGAPTIWALGDVSFEIKHGEIVGIIGRNGAGKSTLLKILSRITEPTVGCVEIRGRVGSLLEVGTGFHPELTGRDNIFLNGAILGMKKAEITRKFDEIVAFAGVEKFIDTPVKRYSSGMYVRLAFAVAAHMETEILLVDEVLAVGDAEFQKKCLGKMGDVAKQGRTVLFVSHAMSSVQRLCQRAILLDRGKTTLDGEVSNVIQEYLSSQAQSEYVGESVENKPCITRARAKWEQPDYILLEVSFASPFPLNPPVLGFVLFDAAGTPLFGTNARFEPHSGLPSSMQEGTIVVQIATDAFRSDTYSISLWLGDQHQDYCAVEHPLKVEVGTGSCETWRPSRGTIGSFRLKTTWQYSHAGSTKN